MGSSPSAPSASEMAAQAAQMAAQQQQMNKDASQWQLSSVSHTGQETPYGSLGYVQTGVDDKGNPTYKAVSQLSPQQQALLNQLQQSQYLSGNLGQQLLYSGGFNSSPNLDASVEGPMKGMMDKYLAYYQPYFDRQLSQADTQAETSGILRGSKAYNNTMQPIRDDQIRQLGALGNQSYLGLIDEFLKNRSQSFGMAQSLMGAGSPANLNNSFTQMQGLPSMQPGNIAAALSAITAADKASYDMQMGPFQSMVSGVGQIGKAALPYLFGM